MNLEQLYSEISNGDPEAFDLLVKWGLHVDRVDNIVDERKDSEYILQAFVEAQNLIIHPFFIRNHNTLYPVLILAANAYSDSAELEKSNKESDRKISDILRSYGNEFIIAIAGICTPEGAEVWPRIRKYSRILRQMSYKEHHNSLGESV